MPAPTADRDRLLPMRTASASQCRPEQPFTLSSGALSDHDLDARIATWDERGLQRVCDAVPGVECSASFTRTERQPRLDQLRAAAR